MLTVTDIPVKPRILIADDSRIVRATLIKQIEGMFEFREALDGEQAWEALLLDQSIRVVITDLTMPRLDGYGLLRRIRASRISRIREIPVVVVSGSDESEERERAKAAGANDLIVKGIGTAQLLSRLDVLAKLVSNQSDLERGLEVLVSRQQDEALPAMMRADVFQAEAEALLQQAQKARRNFVLINVCVALHRPGRADAVNPPETVMEAIGHLLQRTVRQSDHVARTGEEQFTLAAGSISAEAARIFAQRVAHAISRAQLIKDRTIGLVASCGLVSLAEQSGGAGLQGLQELARVRARLGLDRGLTGVIGDAEEAALRHGDCLVPGTGEAGSEPDVATLLQWLKDGRHAEVMPHIAKLSSELRPLVDLLLQQAQR
ncbi:MAG TPA: response regulator [Noviherbaspirillum sp.]|jgi:PleD family two-component response regulator|uniref:response regulator n=1 Tax=Noviherbaspirillum sp. TaxID=1926288 RepID=UPI002F92E19C